MPRLPVVGSDDGTWGGVLNDYLSVSLDADGTLKTTAVPDASAVVRGKIQLAGDLGGTAGAPTVPGLSGKVSATRQILSGTGLSGGGDLTADRTLSVVSDTTTQKVEVATDGTLQSTRKRINFISGAGVTLTAADDSANNKVDVTIDAATGSPASVDPALYWMGAI
jgi:hypothetical protein